MEDALIAAVVEGADGADAACSLLEMSGSAGAASAPAKYQRAGEHNEPFTAADDAKLRQLMAAAGDGKAPSWRALGRQLPYSHGKERAGNLVKRRWDELSGHVAVCSTAAPSPVPSSSVGADSDVESLGGELEQLQLQPDQHAEVQTASTEEAVRKNFRVKRYRGASLSTAIEAVQLPAEVDVGQLAEAVRQGFAAGAKSSNSHVGCSMGLREGKST
jgi:hypothetical protein